MRQVRNSKQPLPEAWTVVAYFYDVESGRKDLAERGQGTDYERYDIPIPREGGIADLLAEASRPDRRFDVVMCESIARVARRQFEGLSIERELDECEVPLFAANEPIMLDGRRSQKVLQRGVNRVIAEYEVLNTLELSWGGLCEHVREGYNIGMPPYGYEGKILPHPNKDKADKGKKKTQLAAHEVRGPVVTQIAHWRYHEGLGYSDIADRLNADPVRYPPPMPPGGAKRARGVWGKSTVGDILRNPKYTGYMVFNRRRTSSGSGQVNDPMKWVWSTQPTHEPLIPKWMYDEINSDRLARRGSRSGNDLNSHPATLRTYVLRGLLFCGCGRRMFGNKRRKSTYYQCWPRANNRGRPDKYEGHPKAVYLREDAVLDAVNTVFNDSVFGPDRHTVLAAELATADTTQAERRSVERERLQRVLADIARQQAAIMTQARAGDPNDPFTQALRTDYNELDSRKNTTLAVIAQLDTEDGNDPHPLPSLDEIALLDELPVMVLTLAQWAPAHLRTLFEVTKLAVALDQDSDQVHITLSLHAAELAALATLAAEQQETAGQTACRGCADGGGDLCEGRTASSAPDVVDAERAPSRTRTCDLEIRSLSLYPAEL